MSSAAGWRQTLGGGALMGSLLVAAMELGGGIYEHAVVCRAWPNLAVFQPQHGGVDRKRFWIPMHVALSALLPVATWAVWPHRESRRLILIADGIYAALRVWTFAYFVPEVMRIEAAPQMTEELEAAGRRCSAACSCNSIAPPAYPPHFAPLRDLDPLRLFITHTNAPPHRGSCSAIHRATSSWPPRTAESRAPLSHGHGGSLDRSHCSTARWPPWAAAWQ
ncbi:hypothetical protein QOT17_010645 [Balamuthia mandrillaris]